VKLPGDFLSLGTINAAMKGRQSPRVSPAAQTNRSLKKLDEAGINIEPSEQLKISFFRPVMKRQPCINRAEIAGVKPALRIDGSRVASGFSSSPA
jgi:hypothetical protein